MTAKLLRALVLGLVTLLVACRGEKPLQPPSLTFAELRVVRSPVSVAEPGMKAKAPYPRQRLIDGTQVHLDEHALVWLRRDDGSVWLVRGAAEFEFQAEALTLRQGRYFANIPIGVIATVNTPHGALRLTDARVSLSVTEDASEAYVLSGEARAEQGQSAGPGERLTLTPQAAIITPEVAWQDWTAGLATTERSPAPPPFGLGTVGARPAGDKGTARVPLLIQRLDLKVRIEGDFAVTEVDQLFFNASSETVEGIYQFRTPEGAMLSRFGVDRGSQLVWGRIKESGSAAEAYEANVYQGSTEDPALLEWTGPGQYQARLYPLEPGAARRIVVRYSQWLSRSGQDGERRLYVYPMAAEGAEASLPRIEEMTAVFDLKKAKAAQVRTGLQGVRKGHELVIRGQDFVPRADLAVELFDQGPKQLQAYRARHRPDLVAVASSEQQRVKREADKESDYLLLPLSRREVGLPPAGIDLAVVVDTSAATEAHSLALASAATDALLEHLSERDRLMVWAGADSLRPLIVEQSQLLPVTAELRKRVLSNLASLQPGGATDLGQMLVDAAQALDPTRSSAVVYIGDGAPTVGERSLVALAEKLARLPRPFRVFALGVGEGVNLQILDGLAKGGFAERLVDRHAAASIALRLLEQLERPTTLGLTVELGASVERAYPRGQLALQADEGLLLVGRVDGTAPKRVMIREFASGEERPLNVTLLDDEGDLRLRWAQARLRELIDEGAGRAALVDLGMRYGIVTPVTSLYVPTQNEVAAESDGDEAESDLDKAAGALAEKKEDSAMGTRAKGEDTTNRRYAVRGPKDEPASAPPEAELYGRIRPESGKLSKPMAASAREEAAPTRQATAKSATGSGSVGSEEGIGLGSINTIGFGAGFGRLGGSHRAASSKLGQGSVQVLGGLPKEVVQRVVRQNYGRYRLCYEQALARTPGIAGRVVLLFVIGKAGNVVRASAASSTLDDSEAVQCLVTGLQSLTFPATEAGEAIVTYPLELSPGDRDNEALAAPVKPSRIDATGFSHRAQGCGLSASLPLAERAVLWRERLAAQGGAPRGVASVYRSALARCEASDWRSRTRLLTMLLDALPQVRLRVELWRTLFDDLGARDTLYRGILARVSTASELSELHAALGLNTIATAALDDMLGKTKSDDARILILQRLRVEWPDDLALHLRLLEALEDAERLDTARELALELRARPDASADLRTAVGEFYLRLARRTAAADSTASGEDLAEAKRSFGEIVEFGPDDPVARRRLGDLLRAHGWFDEARRQYETLAQLVPDDSSVAFLIAAAAEGQGRLEESLQWLEKAAESGDPDSDTGPASVSRALALAYLSWGRVAARAEAAEQELALLVNRAQRVLHRGAAPADSKGTVRVTLSWSHPDFQPALWTTALGALMPAPDGDVGLGVAQAVFPQREQHRIEIRIDEATQERIARYGVEAVLTVVFDELQTDETIWRQKRKFEAGDGAALKFALRGKEVVRE